LEQQTGQQQQQQQQVMMVCYDQQGHWLASRALPFYIPAH